MSTSTIKRGQLTRGVATKGLIFESEFVVTGELKFNLLGDYNFTPSENIAPSTSLLSGTISSGSASGAVTFTLDNDAEGRISIASTGNKTFSISTTGHGFNHSIQTSYPFKVRAVDSAGDSITRSGTINVTDVDNSPTVTSSLTDCAYVQGVHPRTGIGLGTASGRIRVLTTASGERSTYSISGARELGTWIVPDVDGEGASVYLNRVTQPGQGGTESAALTAGDRTFTVSHKGDDSTAQTATLAAGDTISGPTTPLPTFQWELGTTQGVSFSIPNVQNNVDIPYQTDSGIYYNHDGYDNTLDTHNRWETAQSATPLLRNKSGSGNLTNGATYTFNFFGFRYINLSTSATGAPLAARGTSDAHTIGSIYTGPNATSPAGHTTSDSINFTDDNFLLEEIPLPKNVNIVPNISGQTITFTQNGSDDLEDTLGRSLSGVNNPTINLYVGDTLSLLGSDRENIQFKDKFLNSDDGLNSPSVNGTPSAQTSGDANHVSLTPTSPGTFYYFNKDDWRGYGVIQVHSRDVQNPFSSGTPAALANWHSTMTMTPRADDDVYTYASARALGVYVRNIYEHTGDENDAGRISLHKTEAGAKASAANVDRLDFTGVSGGQYASHSGMRLAPLYKMSLPIVVSDTTAPSFTSSATGTIVAGTYGTSDILYDANATDTGTGVASYSIVSNTSGLNLQISVYHNAGVVTFLGSNTITAGQTYSFTVRATDGAGNSTDLAVTITGATATTHTISKGTYQPPAAVTYWGAFVPYPNPAYMTGNATVSPGSPAGAFGSSNAIREVSANYNGYTSTAQRHNFKFAIEGNHTTTNPGTSVTFNIGGVSQTLTFASASNVMHQTNVPSGTSTYTIWRWDQGSTEPGATTVWGRIKAAANNTNFTIDVA